MAETLRRAILDSGVRPIELSRRSGVPRAVFSLFLNRKRSITIDTADKIAAVLGLELRSVRKPGKGRKAVRHGKREQ
jgi:plasmid maintenance system antidote protein VapI